MDYTRPSPVQLRPAEYEDLGHYAIDVSTGSMAAGLAGGSNIFTFRNPSGVLVALQELSIEGMIATTAFAAGQVKFQLFVARAFTADSAGGSAITLTGDNGAMRSSMPACQATARIATTAALTAGTWSLDSNPLGVINTHSSGGFQSATPIIGSIYLPDDWLFKAMDGEHPLILAKNEGVTIQATVPATGVWIADVRVKWAELNSY